MYACRFSAADGGSGLDTEKYAHDAWFAGVSEEAFKADHVIGPGGDILNSRYEQVHYRNIIMPGERMPLSGRSRRI